MKKEIREIENRVKRINMSLINISVSVANSSYETLPTISTYLKRELDIITDNLEGIKTQLNSTKFLRLRHDNDVYEDLIVIPEEGTYKLKIVNLTKNIIFKEVFNNQNEVIKYIENYMKENKIEFLEQ